MANPRRKTSKARSRRRRAVYLGGVKLPTLTTCEECGMGSVVRQRHHVCPCGKYRGRQIIEGAPDV